MTCAPFVIIVSVVQAGLPWILRDLRGLELLGNRWDPAKQERHKDVVCVSNTRGRENRETGETVRLMAAQF